MMLDYKKIDLFGKLLFERGLIQPPFQMPNPMPNDACLLHVRQGRINSFSEAGSMTAVEGESFIVGEA